MTREQIGAEKVALQKALLYYESIHGRPVSRPPPPLRYIQRSLISLPAASTHRQQILFTALLCPGTEPGRHTQCLNPIAVIVWSNPGQYCCVSVGAVDLSVISLPLHAALPRWFVFNDLHALRSCCRPIWVSCRSCFMSVLRGVESTGTTETN